MEDEKTSYENTVIELTKQLVSAKNDLKELHKQQKEITENIMCRASYSITEKMRVCQEKCVSFFVGFFTSVNLFCYLQIYHHHF